MKHELNIVTTLPLGSIIIEGRELQLTRNAYLNTEDIKTFLNLSPVSFLIAEVGKPLVQISSKDCYKFWKENNAQIANNPDEIFLDDFERGWCYLASLWEGKEPSIILLEMIH